MVETEVRREIVTRKQLSFNNLGIGEQHLGARINLDHGFNDARASAIGKNTRVGTAGSASERNPKPS